MQKVNFSNAGLQQLLQELYLLTDQELQQEAMLIQTNLKQWLKDHFIFNDEQLYDLSALDNAFTDEAAIEFAYFVLHRLPVSLYKQQLPATAKEPGRGKLYRKEQQKVSTYSPLLGTCSTQVLSFSISYLQGGEG